MNLESLIFAGGGFLISSLTSLGAIFISNGVMKEKIRRLEKDALEHRNGDRDLHDQIRSEYVTLKHFEAIISPMRDGLHDMQKDIKTILSRLPTDGISKRH